MILGGLLSATALNMIVLPALYWMYGERVASVELENVLAPVAPVQGRREPALAV